MSRQAAHIIHGQASAPSPGGARGDEAIYSFTGALNGASKVLDFGLFALAQGSEEAGPSLRAAARRLLRAIYLPLLPWKSTDRPNALDAIAGVVEPDQETLPAMAVAVILNKRAYLGWRGDARAYLLTAESIEYLVAENAEPVTAQAMPDGAHLLLCTADLWQAVPAEEMLQVVQQAPTVQAACNQLVGLTTRQDGASRPLVILVYRPG
jgi:hypothetical protein